MREKDAEVRKSTTETNRGDNDARYLEPTKTPPSLDTAGLTTRGQEVKVIEATSRAGALWATTMAALLCPGDGTEVHVSVVLPDSVAGASAGRLITSILVTLVLGVTTWSVWRYSLFHRSYATAPGEGR